MKYEWARANNVLHTPHAHPSIQIETKNSGHEKHPREGNASKNLGTSHHPGDQATRPRKGTFRSSPLAGLDGSAPSFSGDTEGWSAGPEGSGGARERRGPVGYTKKEMVLKVLNDIITIIIA